VLFESATDDDPYAPDGYQPSCADCKAQLASVADSVHRNYDV
jgi:hypothetical protein